MPSRLGNFLVNQSWSLGLDDLSIVKFFSLSSSYFVKLQIILKVHCKFLCNSLLLPDKSLFMFHHILLAPDILLFMLYLILLSVANELICFICRLWLLLRPLVNRYVINHSLKLMYFCHFSLLYLECNSSEIYIGKAGPWIVPPFIQNLLQLRWIFKTYWSRAGALFVL